MKKECCDGDDERLSTLCLTRLVVQWAVDRLTLSRFTRSFALILVCAAVQSVNVDEAPAAADYQFDSESETWSAFQRTRAANTLSSSDSNSTQVGNLVGIRCWISAHAVMAVRHPQSYHTVSKETTPVKRKPRSTWGLLTRSGCLRVAARQFAPSLTSRGHVQQWPAFVSTLILHSILYSSCSHSLCLFVFFVSLQHVSQELRCCSGAGG